MGVVSYVFSSKQGFQDLADRLARVVHAWASWEPEHKKAVRRVEHLTAVSFDRLKT